MYLLNLMAMLGSIVVGIYVPELIPVMPDGFMEKDIMQTIVVVSCIIGIIFKCRAGTDEFAFTLSAG